MHGFKSFANRTEVLLGDKFNCVLGPNGSGKSNIMDALCFVLGRGSAKAMRAEKSANLIYNGGKTKQAAKFGEVSIYFDNKNHQFPFDEEEIKVTRMVNQNGSSKYKINNKASTRQELLEMLSQSKIDPDGFNIVLQGDIVRFVEMPPIERRKIVEEIAGISIYEQRKEKALRELTGVEQKLNDAELILGERKNYLKELAKDRNHALKFKELRDKVDENKASYLNIQIKTKQKIHHDFVEKLDKEKHKIEDIENQVNALKKINEEKRKETDKISRDIEEKGEKEQVTVHKEIETLKVLLATNRTRMENCSSEIEKIKQRKTQLNSDLKGLACRIKEFESKKNGLEKEKNEKLKEEKVIEASLSRFRQKNNLDNVEEIEREIENIDSVEEKLQKEIMEIRQQQQNLLRKKDQLEYELKTIDEKLAKVKEVESESNEQIKNLKNRKDLFKKKTLELNTALSDDSTLAARLREVKTRYETLHEKQIKLQAKNVGIMEASASNMATKKIKELKLKGVYGTIAELGQVSSKYSLALEVASGNKIESIVVENDKIAAECINYLKSNRLGIATFVPLNKIKPVKSSSETKKLSESRGVHGLAIDLVTYDNKFKDAFSYVFGNTLVIDDINTARRIGIGAAKMVTLEGDLADFSGVMRGGYRMRKKGSGFVEHEVTKDIEKCELEVAEIQGLISALDRKRKENELNIDTLRQEKAELEGEIIKFEKSLHLESGDLEASMSKKEGLNKELNETDTALKEVLSKITKLNRELANNKIQRQNLRNKISTLRNPKLVAELHTFEEQKKDIKEKLIQIEAEKKNYDTHISLTAPEQEKINEILKQHDKEMNGFDKEIKSLTEAVKTDEENLKVKEKQAKEFYAKYKTLFAERSKLSDDISKANLKIDYLRDNSRKAEISLNTLSLENVHIKAELKTYEEEFEQYKGIKLNDLPEADLKREIDKFEKMVQNMGAVNMKALEIYEKVETEYNLLLEKKKSLSDEKEDVLLLINEIESRKKNIFMEAFNVVNTNFQNFFRMLSTKGEASLVIENSEDLFEAGLLIKVRLTGTKFLDIRSLSGGEKTMTALAFIFAVQEHQPHSFYVLDEVDAALDKHNSEKLAKLVRKYCDHAQYLVISHNDAVIGEANNLYGISMNEHGISNITTLKL